MHPHVEAEGGELPEVGVDNGYLGKDRRRTMPLLVAKDRRTHMLAGTAVESKRRHDYSTSLMTAFLLSLGWKRFVSRSDGWPSLLALFTRVAMNLPGIGVVPKTSPERDHAANGLAEVAVRQLRGQRWVVQSHLEQGQGRRFEGRQTRHLLGFLATQRTVPQGTECSLTVARRTREELEDVGDDIKLSSEKTYSSRRWVTNLRTYRGLCIGHNERSGATLFLTPDGVMLGSSVVRQLEALRWDIGFSADVQGITLEASAEPARHAAARGCRRRRWSRSGSDCCDGSTTARSAKEVRHAT